MEPFGAAMSSTLGRGTPLFTIPFLLSFAGPNGGYSLSKTHWNLIGQFSSAFQIMIGVLLFLMASVFLMHTSRSSGQLIGALSVAFGVIGVLGLRLKGTPLQLLFIVGMGFLAVMTFEFTVQVGRDVEVHCSLAETYNRLAHLESTLTSMKHDELVSQLFVRLNEMDDMLDMVESGTIEKLDMKWRQESLIQQDTEFVSAKIQGLKAHAEKVMDHIIAEASKASDKEKHETDPKLIKKQKEIQKTLMERLEKVESLLDVMEDREAKLQPLTYEEFETVFNALSGTHSNPELMERERHELPILKDAMHRMETNEHHTGPDVDKAKELAKHREDQRIQFESMFHKTFAEHGRMDPAEFDASLAAAMEDLPEHCLMETARYDYFLFGGWLLIASQMAAAYVAATSLFISNIKKDF